MNTIFVFRLNQMISGIYGYFQAVLDLIYTVFYVFQKNYRFFFGLFENPYFSFRKVRNKGTVKN